MIIRRIHPQIYGIAHSIAFANYSEGLKPFHETKKKDFLQAVDISCYSLYKSNVYFVRKLRYFIFIAFSIYYYIYVILFYSLSNAL